MLDCPRLLSFGPLCYSVFSMKTLHDIIQPVLSKIQAGQKTVEVSELWGASKAFFLFGLSTEVRFPVIVVTASEEEAEALAEDLSFFVHAMPRDQAGEHAITIHAFPAWGVLPFEADSPDSRTVGERMRFLYQLVSGEPGIYLVPAQALTQKLPPWTLFVDSIKTITAKTQIDPDRLTAALVTAGYESASLVTRVGEFSRRGGIIDFFSPLNENPSRMEFFGDTIESIREFDPETQRSTAEIGETVVLPVREVLINDQGIERYLKRFTVTSDAHGISTQNSIDQIQQGVLPPGVEFLAPFFYEMESLFHYLPHNSVFALIEPDDLKKDLEEQGRKREEGRQRRDRRRESAAGGR